MTSPTELVAAADAYILALRQILYSSSPEVRLKAKAQIDTLASQWRVERAKAGPDND